MFQRSAYLSIPLMAATFAASSLSHASPSTQPMPDFSAQTNALSAALMGFRSTPQNVGHYYVGTNHQGQACTVSVQNDTRTLSVDVKTGGSKYDGDFWSVPYQNLYLQNVTLKAYSTYVESTTVNDKRVNQLIAEVDARYPQLGRLARVSVSDRETAGRLSSSSSYCGNLRPTLQLNQTDMESLSAQIRAEYERRYPGESLRGFTSGDPAECGLTDASTLSCDFSLPADRTDDTLHVKLGVKNGIIQSIISFDYEPGC